MSKEMTRVHENLGARKIHFSLANVWIIAQVLKEIWLKNHGFCSFKNNDKKNLWMKVPTIPPGLAGKIEKKKIRPLSKPPRWQDLEDSARSKA